MGTLRQLIIVTTMLTLSIACAKVAKVDPGQYAPEVQSRVSAVPAWVERSAIGTKLWAIEQAFYEERQFLPVWIDGDQPTPRLDALLQALRDSDHHGLEPARYGADAFTAARARTAEKGNAFAFNVGEVPELDLKLTYAYLLHAADLLGWRWTPRDIDRNWLGGPRKADLAEHLRTAVDGNRVRESLDDLAPAHPQYRGLQAALKRDDAEAVARREQVRMNLERWRWAPRDLGERHILINVPAYWMQVVEGDKPVLAMRVIVGAPRTPTPLFSDEMTYVVFSPYWNIPPSILQEETLPRAVKDPDFLRRNNMQVVRGNEVVDPSDVDWSSEDETRRLRLRQAPGPGNALGLVKFVFPNHFDVYLHDTPNDRLFNKPKRPLSHGCIRIENPAQMAEYVLGDHPEWPPARIAGAMRRDSEQAVKLKKPIPVHIGYWTAWVEGDGRVTFTDDPYGFDRKQAAIMRTAAPPPERRQAE